MHKSSSGTSVGLGTASLHSPFCHLFSQSVSRLCSVAGARAGGFPLASLKYRQICRLGVKGGDGEREGGRERMLRLSAILHFFCT